MIESRETSNSIGGAEVDGAVKVSHLVRPWHGENGNLWHHSPPSPRDTLSFQVALMALTWNVSSLFYHFDSLPPSLNFLVTFNTVSACVTLVSFAAVLMARTPPQLTSAEPSETFHSTKLANDIEASRFKKPALWNINTIKTVYKYTIKTIKYATHASRGADLMASSGWLVLWR